MASGMGSSLISVFVSKICSTLLLFARPEMSSRIEGKLDRMKELLLLVQRAVRTAEKRQITNDDLNNWLRELKDIERRAQDVLNSFQAHSANHDDDSRKSSSLPRFLHQLLLTRSPEASRRNFDEKVNQLHATLEALEMKASLLHSFLKLVDMHSSLPPDDRNRLHGHGQLSPAQTEISELLESDSSYSGSAVEIADADGFLHPKPLDSSEGAASPDGFSTCRAIPVISPKKSASSIGHNSSPAKAAADNAKTSYSKRKIQALDTVMQGAPQLLRHASSYSDTPAAPQVANPRATKMRRTFHRPAKGSAGLASSSAAATLGPDDSDATS